jgi:hypothetical protein
MMEGARQKQIEKLKQDTYKVRKEEGRPKHGQTSLWIMGLGVVSWMMLCGALFLPEWRTNWFGMIGYMHKRSWGLMVVNGQKSTMHHEMMQDACRYFSQLRVAGICASPVCVWYSMKCQVYMDLAMISYSAAFGWFLCAILHTLCMFWTMRLTPRMIRWAAIWWVAQVIIHMSLVTFWFLMTSESFNSLDAKSMYPEPDLGYCFYMECLVVMIVTTNAVLGITLMKMWPEESSDDSDDSSEEDSDDPLPGMPPGMMGGPPMMGPPQGMMMMPPQGGPPPGYDPSMGPPPPGMMGGPPPGYDPNMPPPDMMMGGPPPMQMQGMDPNMGPPMQMQGMDPNMGGLPPPGYDPNMGGLPPPGYDPSMGPPPPGMMGGPPPPGDFGIQPPGPPQQMM